jgi:hypothetical protein
LIHTFVFEIDTVLHWDFSKKVYTSCMNN